MIHIKNEIWNAFHKIREKKPLICNLTNSVVMNTTANAQLAIGASPIVSQSIDEIEEIVQKSDCLLINIGTLEQKSIELFKKAIKVANRNEVPIVIDPVGAGFTKFRTRTMQELLEMSEPTLIRGNAAEMMALAGSEPLMKGVDSLERTESALDSLTELSHTYDCVLSASGETDVVVKGDKLAYIGNGTLDATLVTGMGCIATAVSAAFIAIMEDDYSAAIGAMAIMGVCEEAARQHSHGPGSFYVAFIDALYTLKEEEFYHMLRIQL
ncbi:MAG: hydroxyethylthiazole kinase [Hyphomicrobiales bacterium]